MSQEIKVSVFCLVYNHEKYLRKCLDGFVMQKTNFKFEVLINDDSSTDASADIIREYELKYPDIIKPFYQTENQYSKGVKITREILLPLAKGDYFAICEGDDYWRDPLKLQKQFDILKNNDNCVLAVHKVLRIFENGEDSKKFYPTSNYNTKVYSSNDFIEKLFEDESFYFQTSSYFFKKEYYIELQKTNPDFTKDVSFGDWPLLLYLATRGDVAYLNEAMSCYRMNSNGGWSSSTSFEKKNKEHIIMLKRFDKFTNGEYHNSIYKAVNKRTFLLELKQRNYNEILKKKYRFLFYKELTIKDRIYIYYKVFVSFIKGGKPN